MKTFIKPAIILFAFTALGWTFQGQFAPKSTNPGNQPAGQSILAEGSDSQFLTGVIALKLKMGVGDFGKQTGMVSFGVPSLDEKVALFEVSQLDKRFRYNPAKLRPDLPDLSRIYRLSFPEAFPVQEVAAAFSADPNVEYAEPIPIERLTEIPNDALWSQLQHLPQIYAPEAWNIHKGENGTEEIVIAINDTGVDWDHEDLISNIWQNLAEDADNDGHTMEFNGMQWVLDPGDLNGVDDDGNGYTDDLLGWNFITGTGDPNPAPDNPVGFHGTHCGGISNGATNNDTGISSISWNLKLMPVCADANNTLQYGYDGIIYAAENGADIISNSWGGPNYSIAGQEAVSYAAGLGSIILAAAGNDNISDLFYPADYQNVISVAAVNPNDTKTGYSCFNLAVDISAPGGGDGGGILSTLPNNTYGPNLGTSMATPMVAGSLGLLKSYHPDWSNDQLITQILGTADNIDSLNPNYINMLGTGRVNAYRMLAEENVLPFLKLELLSVSTSDASGNGINEPGELVSLNFTMKNHAQGLGVENVLISIQSDDPEVILVNGSCSSYIPSDSVFSLNTPLTLQLAANATSHVSRLTLHFETDSPILTGEEFTISLLCAPSGIFVFEGEEGGQAFSGKYITQFLDHLGYAYTYANDYPSLLGFETVFLSHGNFGENFDKGALFRPDQAVMVQQFLESGGNLYIEMGGMFYRMLNASFPNIFAIRQLLGVSAYYPTAESHPVDTLTGMAGTPMQGMMFTGSDQKYNWYIDKMNPATTAMTPFTENSYGKVSVMNNGAATYGHKSFYFGYSLADLHDRSSQSSRYNMLLKTMEYFDYPLPYGYVLANFITAGSSGAPPLEVQFTDISIGSPSFPINSWQWDFDNDGIIDSWARHPSWTYPSGGAYDVKLIVSNGVKSDTLVMEDCVMVNTGYFVYEGVPDGIDYSGKYINDYLEQNIWSVTYRNAFPPSLLGYRAVFLSFGNSGSGNTLFTDQMAETVKTYLEAGGYVYLEGGDALGNDQADNTALINLFGLNITTNGTGDNPINSLQGKPTAITHDMVFTGNSQSSNASIDKYAQSSSGTTAFTEAGYGTVAVQHSIENGRRTFCFSYSLANLTDGDYPSTREELLQRILNFFDIYTGEPERPSPAAFTLEAYPNPLGQSIHIEYRLAEACQVTLTLFNQLGQTIEVLCNEYQSAGHHPAIWNASDAPSGIYLLQLKTGKQVITKKIIKQ